MYVAFVIDAFARRIVGWRVTQTLRTDLVLDALEQALYDRPLGAAPELVHHSDSEYMGACFRAVLTAHGMLGSMSRRGDCLDNDVMERWFSTVKQELGERFESCRQSKMELFDYIEVFYNQRRRHTTLGPISPAEFERRRLTPAA